MIVTYPDGSNKEFVEGSTFLDVAKDISEGFARKALVVSVNGSLYDLSSRIPGLMVRLEMGRQASCT